MKKEINTSVKYSAREFLTAKCQEVDSFVAIIWLKYYYQLELDECISIYHQWRNDYIKDVKYK